MAEIIENNGNEEKDSVIDAASDEIKEEQQPEEKPAVETEKPGE